MNHIYVHESPLTFHLQNDELSYILTILPGGLPGQLYCGKRLRDRESFEHLRTRIMPFSAALTAVSDIVPEESVLLEYPSYGSSDYRQGGCWRLNMNPIASCQASRSWMPFRPPIQRSPAKHPPLCSRCGTA